jgi:hypothetical protein
MSVSVRSATIAITIGAAIRSSIRTNPEATPTLMVIGALVTVMPVSAVR